MNRELNHSLAPTKNEKKSTTDDINNTYILMSII